MNTNTSPTHVGRIRSLDGVRGVAALIVLIHHSALLFPPLAATYYSRSATSDGFLVWWLTHTPLHLLWEGDSAVYIFFILSGVVLASPFLSKPFSALHFYPQRILRLYLPVWAAVIFAALTVHVVPRHNETNNYWLNGRAESVTLEVLARDISLVRGPGGLASPLWSLQWEILFSLALPLYLWLAFKLRGHLAAKLAVLLTVISVSAIAEGTAELVLRYMPMFMIGVVMIIERQTLTRWAALTALRPGIMLGLFSTGCLLLSSRWYSVVITSDAVIQKAMIGPMALGAAVMIFTGLHWEPVKAFLETFPVQWLGKISFSLYLIHEPIIVTLGYLMGSALAPVAAILSFVVSLLLAPLFFRWIELPSHRLAKGVQAMSQSSSWGIRRPPALDKNC